MCKVTQSLKDFASKISNKPTTAKVNAFATDDIMTDQTYGLMNTYTTLSWEPKIEIQLHKWILKKSHIYVILGKTLPFASCLESKS